jgi:hypothetical protein
MTQYNTLRNTQPSNSTGVKFASGLGGLGNLSVKAIQIKKNHIYRLTDKMVSPPGPTTSFNRVASAGLGMFHAQDTQKKWFLRQKCYKHRSTY